MIVKKDICYAKAQHNKGFLDIYLPETTVEKVMIYFHGGGLEAGNKELPHVERYTDRNIAVVCPNYRIYPDAKYPEFIEDAAEAVAYIKNNLNLVDNCDDIYIGGSSAGGYLSLMLYFDEKYLAKYGLSVNDFSGFIHDAGQPTTHFNVLRERGIDSRRVVIDEAAPIYHIEEYVKKPKMMIFVSEKDIYNRLEQTTLLISTLKDFHYPTELVTYHYMENYGHCEYKGDRVFCDLICNFIFERK